MTWCSHSRVLRCIRTAALVAGVVPLTFGVAAPVAAAPAGTAAVSGSAAPASASAQGPSWRIVHQRGDADLRGLDAVSARVAWASGSGGTVLRTTDGGRSWRNVGPPRTGGLEFRDIEAFDADSAVILSIGGHAGSFRVYRTSNGGRSWAVTFRNREPQAFYDCMAFFDRQHGVALSDPVNGKFRILATNDGGRSWHVKSPAGLPNALPGEFAFAASGTCLVTKGPQDAWFATGGADRARVFHTTNRGRTWKAVATPIRSGPTAGIYSLAFRNRLQGLAIGGDFQTPDYAPRALALTADGGRTWTLVGRRAAPGEYRSGSAWIPGTRGIALVVGPTGSDISTDGGFRWRRFAQGSFDSVDCAADGACWASGASERIARLQRG